MTLSQHRAGVEPVLHLRALCHTSSMCGHGLSWAQLRVSNFCHVILMAITALSILRVLRIRHDLLWMRGYGTFCIIVAAYEALRRQSHPPFSSEGYLWIEW